MQFQARSEEDLQKENLLPKGEYQYEVLEAIDTKSKANNDMIRVNLGIYQGDAMRQRIYDYLLASMGAKLRHFCDSAGLLAKYEAGTLAAQDCMGRSGWAIVDIEVDKNGTYPPKNVVRDYKSRLAKPLLAKPAPPAVAEADDDVPF